MHTENVVKIYCLKFVLYDIFMKDFNMFHNKKRSL